MDVLIGLQFRFSQQSLFGVSFMARQNYPGSFTRHDRTYDGVGNPAGRVRRLLNLTGWVGSSCPSSTQPVKNP